MKQLNLTYEDKEFQEITAVKDKHGGNWHDFILDLIRMYKDIRLKE